MSANITFSVEKNLGMIQLHRQKSLNALTHEMILALAAQLKAWAVDDKIHAVIIRSIEGRAFCAGGDVRSLYELGMKAPHQALQFFKDEYQLNYLISQYPKPYLPLLHGLTFGGGAGISLHSPYAIASEDFIFAMPETSIGFFPDVGASYLLSRCRDSYGIYLGLTGARLNTTQAFTLGLIKAIIPSTQFDDFIQYLLTHDLSCNPAEKINHCIKKYQVNSEDSLEQAEQIHRCFSAQSITQVKLNLEAQNTRWADEVKQQLDQKSPASLAVTFEQLKRAKNASLLECLKMDYILASHFMQHHDFFEGVRALLVDKDKTPRWSDPDDLNTVRAYFEGSETLDLFGYPVNHMQ